MLRAPLLASRAARAPVARTLQVAYASVLPWQEPPYDADPTSEALSVALEVPPADLPPSQTPRALAWHAS